MHDMTIYDYSSFGSVVENILTICKYNDSDNLNNIYIQ